MTSEPAWVSRGFDAWFAGHRSAHAAPTRRHCGAPLCRRPQLAQGLAQLGPVAAGAGGLGDDLPAVRRGERVELGLVFLPVPQGTH